MIRSICKILLFSLLFCFAAAPVPADQRLDSEAAALFSKAEAVLGWNDSSGMPPFEVNGDLTLYSTPSGTLHGTLHRYVADPKDWIQEIRFGKYQQIRARKGEDTYKHENADFTPLQIEQLSAAFSPRLSVLDNQQVARIKTERLHDAQAVCVYIEWKQKELNFAANRVRRCFDSQTGALLETEDGDREVRWQDYRELAGKLVPGTVEILEGGKKTADAQLTYQQDPTLTAERIKIPAGLHKKHSCANEQPPTLLHKTEPSFPVGVRRANITVVLGVVIGTDGQVHKMQVMETGGKDYNDAAESAARQWRFKPDLCDGTPREVMAQIEVNFRLR